MSKQVGQSISVDIHFFLQIYETYIFAQYIVIPPHCHHSYPEFSFPLILQRLTIGSYCVVALPASCCCWGKRPDFHEIPGCFTRNVFLVIFLKGVQMSRSLPVWAHAEGLAKASPGAQL